MAAETWAITDHVCRACLGRVLRRADRHDLFRCADCGMTASQGEALCACGALLRTGVRAGLRCVANATRSAESPAEVVVVFVGVESTTRRPNRAALRCSDDDLFGYEQFGGDFESGD